jgi:hypothetical protein
MNTSLRSISQFNILKRCARALKELSLQLFYSLLPEQERGAVLQNLTMNWRGWNALAVGLGIQIGLLVKSKILQTKISLNEVWTNKRVLTGWVVGSMAFPAWKCYALPFLDFDAVYEDWYFGNWVFFLREINLHLVILFASIGLFLALPLKVGYRWIALPVLMFCVTDIYEITTYNYYKMFYQGVPSWQGLVIGLLIVPALMFVLDYQCYRKCHLKDGNAARVMGIFNLNMSWDEKKVHFEKLNEEMKNYNSRI